jgi:gamma-glutamylcyclotransferase (GGCT)/AIG2-like uncharacterized protein YtfP
MQYYFAYGSNMSETQMMERCPYSKPVGVAVLKNYALAFTGYSSKRASAVADVIEDSQGEVWGILFELTDTDVSLLDKFEGYPTRYQKIKVSVLLQNNCCDTIKPIEAFTYVIVHKKKQKGPTNAYLNILINAAVKHHFPEWYQKVIHNFSRNT